MLTNLKGFFFPIPNDNNDSNNDYNNYDDADNNSR